MKKTDEKKTFIAAIDSSYIRDAQMYDAETPDGLDEDNWREIQGPIIVFCGKASNVQEVLDKLHTFYNVPDSAFLISEVVAD